MAEKKEKLKLNTWEKIWPRLIGGWFIMYLLSLVAFPLFRPNISVDSPKYQSFMWLWLQLYLALFVLVFIAHKDLSKRR